VTRHIEFLRNRKGRETESYFDRGTELFRDRDGRETERKREDIGINREIRLRHEATERWMGCKDEKDSNRKNYFIDRQDFVSNGGTLMQIQSGRTVPLNSFLQGFH
jgi:hypothetical protein